MYTSLTAMMEFDGGSNGGGGRGGGCVGGCRLAMDVYSSETFCPGMV